MNKIVKRMMTMFVAGTMALSLLAPVTGVSAASRNQVVEVPVNFTNSGWEDDWDSNSLTNVNFWNFSEPSSYSERYTLSYKLYIPVSFLKAESAIHIDGGLNLNDASAEEWKYAGWLIFPSVVLHEDLSLTVWDEEQQKDVPVDYATVKKSGEFYVLTYKAENGVLNTDDAKSDVTKAEKVAVDPNILIKGINITAKNSAVYLDDIRIAKADGTVLASKNYTSARSVDANCIIAPKNDWEKDAKALKIVTLTASKSLTVKSTKVTVGIGKTAKISATATPTAKITYKSSNKKIATVNAKGVITGKKAGKAVISVKANGKTVKVTVTVKKSVSVKSVAASNTMPEDYSTKPVKFQSKIDAFHKKIKEIPLTDEETEYSKAAGISLRRLEIDGTQLYEARPNDGKVKPLLIQMHGGGWHKEWGLAVDYAVASGLCVVSIDEAGAGDSKDGPLQGPAAYMETVKDIDSIIEYYNTRSDVDASNFGLTGYSMGGTLSFYYVVYGKYKPTAICPCNPSVDLTGEGPAWDCFNKGVNGQTPIWTEDQIWAFTAATAPKNHPEMFKDIWMYICVGANDDTHSPKNVEKFVNSVKSLGSKKIVFRCFKNVGHETPASWEKNEQQQFYKKLLNS